MSARPKNETLWKKAISLAKRKFKVYPSRYANYWAAAWYKKQGGTWLATSTESVFYFLTAKLGGFSRFKRKGKAFYKGAGVDFTIPEGVKRQAQRGLDLRASLPKSKRGGLDAGEAKAQGIKSGVSRARQLVNGKEINPTDIDEMVAFFNRHSAFKDNHVSDPQGKAKQSWLLWGGNAGFSWAKRLKKAMDKAEAKAG